MEFILAVLFVIQMATIHETDKRIDELEAVKLEKCDFVYINDEEVPESICYTEDK